MANPANERRLKNRFLVYTGEHLGPWFLRALFYPNRWVVEGAHYYKDALRQGKSVIIAAWHGRLLPVFMDLSGKGYHAIAGTHYPDAEIISRIGGRMGWRVLRGSTTDGGRQAYEAMLKVLREPGRLLAITPDGPQGPAKIPKPGTIRAAQKTGALIVPVSAQSTRRWGFTNWDTFYVAKPFGRIEIVYGPPVIFTPQDDYQTCATLLTQALNTVEKEVDQRVAAAANP